MTVEDLKAIKQLEPHLDSAIIDGIISSLQSSRQDYELRVKGLEKQDEFIMILYLLKICKSCMEVEEGISQVFETKSSDFIVELNNGKKMFIEVKTTTKNKFKISEKCLAEKKALAKSMELDLYFAICLHGRWMFFNSDYIENNQRHITVADFLNSEFDDVFDTWSFLFFNGLSILSIYTNEEVSYPTVRSNFGSLTKWELSFRGKIVLKGDASKGELAYVLALTALQDYMKEIQNVSNADGKQTLTIETLSEPMNIIPEYAFLIWLLLSSPKFKEPYFSLSAIK